MKAVDELEKETSLLEKLKKKAKENPKKPEELKTPEDKKIVKPVVKVADEDEEDELPPTKLKK